MLEPDYFYGKSDVLISYEQELEDWILQDIAMRLLKAEAMAGTTDMELYKLRQLGLHQNEIVKRLSALTQKSTAEIRSLLQDAVLTSWDDDKSTLSRLGIDAVSPLENPVVMDLLDAEFKKTLGEVNNLTRSTMMQSQRDLMNMLNEAEMRVSAGVQSYSAAVCDILDQYGKTGVMVDYPTGTRRTLESAVRMCVVTSMNQTAAQVTNHYIAEHNVEYVLVSAHLGARTQGKGQPYLAGHDNWQGKCYKISGSEPDAPNLAEMTGYDIVNGTGHVLNPLGLHGYNCRHSHKPWNKSLRNPYLDENGNLKIDSEENQKVYELQQQQRAMERAIRQTKRQLIVKQAEIDGVAETAVKEMLQPQYDKLAYKLRMQNRKYNQFCADNGLRTQADRIKVAGFKKKQSAVANGRATAYGNSINSSDEEDIFSIIKKGAARKTNNVLEHEPVSINELHGKYADEVRSVINEAPENIKSVINKYADQIKFSNEKLIGTGHTNKDGIYVNFKADSINERGAWTTTFHEIGHAVDIATNRISYKYPYFGEYLENDFNNLVKAYQKEYNITREEAYLEIGNSLMPDEYHILSDLAGGLTNNQCKGNYYHSKPGYWEKPHRLEREAFAHFFGAVATKSDIKVSAIKEMFPTAFKEFEKLMEEIK